MAQNLILPVSYLLLFGTSVLILFLTGLFWSIRSTFLKSVLFLAWCFSEHVLPGYKFVSSALVFVGPHVFILETRIVFSWGFSEHVFPGYMFVSYPLVFIGARVLILETCIVFSCYFSEHVFTGCKFVSCSLILSKHVLQY